MFPKTAYVFTTAAAVTVAVAVAGIGLAFANALTALLAARLIFDVPFRGSVTLLLMECIIYSMVSLALGVLVATLTTTQRVAMLVALLATMLPSTLLSGMVFPLASMPRILQVLSNIAMDPPARMDSRASARVVGTGRERMADPLHDVGGNSMYHGCRAAAISTSA